MKSTLIIFFLFSIQIPKYYCGKEEITASSSTKDTQTAAEKEEETPADPAQVFTTALRLMKIKKQKGFYLKDSRELELKKGEIMLNLCPPKSKYEIAAARMPGYEYCLFENKSSTSPMDIVECENKVIPYVWDVTSVDDRNRCAGSKAWLYTFVYQVCRKSKSIILKIPILADRLSKYFPKIKNEFVEVYTMCVAHHKDLIYVKYTLVAATEEESRHIVENEALQHEVEGYVHFNFYRLPDLYKKESQDAQLKKIFGNDFDDYLIPQKLISPKHIKPLLARNSLYAYTNIGPLWNSIKDRWQQLEDRIWNLGLNNSRNIMIFAGTLGNIPIKDGAILKIAPDNFASLVVPAIWWKLIIDESKKGIILVIQNEPKNFPVSLSTEKLCNKSICNENGWEEIHKIADYCCEFISERMQKTLNLQDEHIDIIGVFNPKTSSTKGTPANEAMNHDSTYIVEKIT